MMTLTQIMDELGCNIHMAQSVKNLMARSSFAARNGSAFWCEKPCDNCPYAPDTEAAKNESTASKAEMCVRERIPFMCHRTMKRVAIAEMWGRTIYDDYATKVCAGWIRETSNADFRRGGPEGNNNTQSVPPTPARNGYA